MYGFVIYFITLWKNLSSGIFPHKEKLGAGEGHEIPQSDHAATEARVATAGP